MNRWKPFLLRCMLDVLYFAGIHRLLGRSASGVGAILTLHHVGAMTDAPFAPNRILTITPEFLEDSIQQIRALGYEFLTLDEMRQRLLTGNFDKKFVCITLDDGYLDNLVNAAPIFERHGVPYTIYVTTSMPEGKSVLWWQHLEEIVRDHEQVRVVVGDRELSFSTESTRSKYRAFNAIYWALRAAPHDVQQTAIHNMLATYEVISADLCRDSALSWSNLRQLSAEGRASIGAHTVNHYALSKLSGDAARQEADQSRRVLAEQLGTVPRHFCYPFGDAGSAGPREFELIKQLEFATATTTRKGVVFAEHRDHLHALPRISLNGDYQKPRYVKLFLSGAPFALINGWRRRNVH